MNIWKYHISLRCDISLFPPYKTQNVHYCRLFLLVTNLPLCFRKRELECGSFWYLFLSQEKHWIGVLQAGRKVRLGATKYWSDPPTFHPTPVSNRLWRLASTALHAGPLNSVHGSILWGKPSQYSPRNGALSYMTDRREVSVAKQRRIS
jgi:hypothetical protein